MVHWSVVPAHPSHVNRLANRMRAIDRAECAAVGHTPKAALVVSLRGSSLAWTVFADDRPVAMFGVMAISVLEGKGAPWLLGTDEIVQGARQFIRWGMPFVREMQREFPHLVNMVGAENDKALRVLRFLGFAVDEESVIIGGMAMRRFSSQTQALGGQ